MKFMQRVTRINPYFMLNHHQLTESSKIIFTHKTLITRILLNNAPFHTIFSLESSGKQDLPEYVHELQN